MDQPEQPEQHRQLDIPSQRYPKDKGPDDIFAPKNLAKYIGLFLLTFVTTTLSGMMWQNEMDLANIEKGLSYSIALLFILSCHEFGHFFAARYHKVNVSLPYYIPFPPIPAFINFGTLGALIRTREPIPSRKALFDIGIAGPIAGFIASLIVLVYGFMNLPGTDFLLAIHPDYDFATNTSAGTQPGMILTFGNTLLYDTIQTLFAPAGKFVPPMTEMYHYPFLITGWFGLMVTALNMLPTGQLDGGHIIYAMFGKWHRIIARVTVGILLFLGAMGTIPGLLALVGLPETANQMMNLIPGYERLFWGGWLFWALLIRFVIRIDHPPVTDSEPLDPRRRALGWISLAIFITCFSPAPLYIQ